MARHDASTAYVNEVRLCGRLSASAEIRGLPSGDEVAVWRLIVERPGVTSGAVDTIDCETYSRRLLRAAAGWKAGAALEVDGALRRRFWKTPTGVRSRYVVDVRAARRVRSMKESHDPGAAVRAP